jgi:hypothetical protein
VRRALLLTVVVGSGWAIDVARAEPPEAPCFDFTRVIDEPLRPPLALVEGRDQAVFGTSPDGLDWGKGRAVLAMPLRVAYAKLLDHRHVKDMKKTTLQTTVRESSHYLQLHEVEVVVTVKVLFAKVKVGWTEEWGYRLVEGTAEEPRRIVISYQKIRGSRHLQHLCGSYVLAAREDGTTDLAFYEEVRASRRSAEDIRNMHAGILKNLRAEAPPAGAAAPP